MLLGLCRLSGRHCMKRKAATEAQTPPSFFSTLIRRKTSKDGVSIIHKFSFPEIWLCLPPPSVHPLHSLFFSFNISFVLFFPTVLGATPHTFSSGMQSVSICKARLNHRPTSINFYMGFWLRENVSVLITATKFYFFYPTVKF